MQGLSISKLACAAKVSADTIRFYERQGLLSPPERGKSGYRSYSELQLHELMIIRQARNVGFTLGEIADLITPRAGTDRAGMRAVIRCRLDSIEQKLSDLQRWRSALMQLLETSADDSPAQCRSRLEQLMAVLPVDQTEDVHSLRGKPHATK